MGKSSTSFGSKDGNQPGRKVGSTNVATRTFRDQMARKVEELKIVDNLWATIFSIENPSYRAEQIINALKLGYPIPQDQLEYLESHFERTVALMLAEAEQRPEVYSPDFINQFKQLAAHAALITFGE